MLVYLHHNLLTIFARCWLNWRRRYKFALATIRSAHKMTTFSLRRWLSVEDIQHISLFVECFHSAAAEAQKIYIKFLMTSHQLPTRRNDFRAQFFIFIRLLHLFAEERSNSPEIAKFFRRLHFASSIFFRKCHCSHTHIHRENVYMETA